MTTTGGIRAKAVVPTVKLTRTVVDKDPNQTKEENEAQARVDHLEKAVDRPPTSVAGPLGSVTWGHQFTLSRRFQSVRMECVVTLPFAVDFSRPMEEQVAQASARTKEMAENLIAEALEDQVAALEELIQRVDSGKR